MNLTIRSLALAFVVTVASAAQSEPVADQSDARRRAEALLAAHGLVRPAPGEKTVLEQRIGHARVGADGRFIPAESTLLREITEQDFIDVEQLGGTEVFPYLVSGDPATCFDLVIVGDGYRAVDTEVFLEHADNILSVFLEASPFRQYLDSINIWCVRAGSQNSGVDHDPVFPIWRSTATDMNFWCDNFESLLCVDTIKLFGSASRAPSADAFVGMANSSKYGSAAYFSHDVVTVSGGHAQSPEVWLYLFAQTFANVTVEYFNPGFAYTGGEPSFPNVTVFDAPLLTAFQWKWFRWLGVNDPAHNGLHSTFQGAYGYQFGIYRPTADSRMRTAGKPFNLPSAEAIILEMYRYMKPIHSVSPPITEGLTGIETLEVAAVQPDPWSATFKWFLNDVEIPDRIGPTLELAELFPPVGSVIKVRVVDPCPLVRDEALRATRMTAERSWTVTAEPCPGDASADSAVDFSDIDAVLQFWLADYAPGTGPGDANRDRVVDFNDITTVLSHWLDECP